MKNLQIYVELIKYTFGYFQRIYLKKYFVLYFVFCFIGVSSVYAQWQVVNSGITGNIVDIRFVSDSIGFALTDSGTVLKSINQGDDWSLIASLNGRFSSLCNVGRDTIFVGGNKIFRSDDCGISWNNISNPGYMISDMEFFTAQRGIYIKPESYLCTAGSGDVTVLDYQAFQTVNGGVFWQQIFENLLPVSRLQLINDSTLYVAGGEYFFMSHCDGAYSNIGMKTINWGSSWEAANPPGIGTYYCNFSFLNDSTGYIMEQNYYHGDYSLWRMEDSISYLVGLFPLGSSQIVFANLIDGYLLRDDSIFITRTEGLSWSLDTLLASDTINKLWNDNNKAMFAIGTNGTILKKQIIESLYPDTIYAMSTDLQSLEFDSTIVGGSITKQIIVHNGGTVALNINVVASDTFRIILPNNAFASNISFSLPGQRDSVIKIRFLPANTSFYQDTLIISSDSAGVKHIPLTGKGTDYLVGSLADTLIICRDTIWVVGDFTIEDGGKLLICPGTVVDFTGRFRIYVSGTLKADGLANDSIWFTPQNKNYGWAGIYFNSTTDLDTSILRFCDLNYVNNSPSYAVNCSDRSNLLIDHCSIYHGFGGIYSTNSSCVISNNMIYDNDASHYGNIPGCAIKCLNDSSLVFNNLIFNNIGFAGTGIWLNNRAPGYPKIIQNLIFNNEAIDNSGAIYAENSTPCLINNTICNNRAPVVGGALFTNIDTNTIISSNIIYNNSDSQLFTNLPDHLKVGYCDIQGGYPGGINVIDRSPNFINPTDSVGVMNQIGIFDWSLNQTSPCINKGDTLIHFLVQSTDLGGNPRVFQNRIDIGVYEFQSLISVNEIENKYSVSLFPNPCFDEINITVENNEEPLELDIYDMLSKQIGQFMIVERALISTKDLARGIYIYQLRNKERVIYNGKIMKQ